MPWRAHLELDYRQHADRCVVFDRHSGPLRVLASLYPEAPTICHNVIVHPPGGIVGGDALSVAIDLAPAAHALLTTPGAARFYRSAGESASQSVTAQLRHGARLEWLPQETTCCSGALAENRLHFDLEPGAEMLGWDLLSLGLPASGQDFERGRVIQTITLGTVWREHGVIDGEDRRLLDSPVGLAGHRVLGTLWFAAGEPLAAARREALLQTSRDVLTGYALRATAGATSPHAQAVVLRVLAPGVEAAQQMLISVWAAWRQLAWNLAPCAPRVWRT